MFDRLGQEKVFYQLDLSSGYCQIQNHFNDVEKAAFTTWFGQYGYTVLATDLCNTPATFKPWWIPYFVT